VEAERAALAALWGATPPPFVSERVPRPLAGENDHFAAWSLETRVAGDATAPPYGGQFLDDCVGFLAALPPAADGERTRSLESDAVVIAQWLPAAQGNALTSLAHEVEAALADVPRGFGHGDFAAGNLLGRDGRLAGVVDWAKGGPGRLPLLDLLHLRANIEAARTRTHLGEVIVQFLLPWAQRGGDRLLSEYRDRAGLTLTVPQLDAAVTAYWLDFIASELAAYADRGRRRAWVEKNVALVAERLLAQARSARSGSVGAVEHDSAPQRVHSLEAHAAVPRVAVVVPCFNDGATLPATLDSVRAQEPCELVVVDDGSDAEQTLELLRELAACGTQVVRQENRGPAAARMTGVRSTSAPYVLPLDADDLVAPGALTALADALDRDPDAVVAWGNTQMFGDAAVHVPKARSLDAWQITYVNPIPTATMIRRDALLDVDGWQLETGYEDWDLWMAFAERGWRGVHLNMTVALHRVHTSRQFSRDFGRHAQIEDELRRRHEALFRHRRRNWLRSTAPWRVRLLLPIVYALPLVPRTVRFRLAVLVGNPLVVPRLWLQARRARAARAAAE
jgi:hypothetical protein